MRGPLCVDASLAAKWLAYEPGTAEAIALLDALDRAAELWAPELLWIECANALRHKVEAGEIAVADASSSLAGLMSSDIRTLCCSEVAEEALAVALYTGLSTWDATYIVTARRVGAELWTADRQMESRGRRAYGNVRLLTWADTDDPEVAT